MYSEYYSMWCTVGKVSENCIQLTHWEYCLTILERGNHDFPNRNWNWYTCISACKRDRNWTSTGTVTYVLGVQLSDGTDWNDVRPNQKWKIQDVGLQTSNTFISTSRQDINKITTVIHLTFRDPTILWHFREYCSTTPELVIPRWRLKNRKYTYLSL